MIGIISQTKPLLAAIGEINVKAGLHGNDGKGIIYQHYHNHQAENKVTEFGLY